MTKWLFLGDDSRRIFASWILHLPVENLDEDKSFTIKRGLTPLEKNISDTDEIIFSTYFLPPEIEIFVPAYSDDMKINTERFDHCAIFEMFPFGKESTEDLAKLLEMSKKNSPMLLFVLMDIVDDEEDNLVGLQTAKKFLLKKNRDIIIAEDENSVLEVLHWHRPLATDLTKQIRRELQNIYKKADEISEDYKNFLNEQRNHGCLNDATKNKITSFNSIKGKSLIWISYIEAATKILFPTTKTGGLKNLLDLYCRVLYKNDSEETFASLIWNVQADCNQLIEKLREKFLQNMKTPKKFQDFLSPEEFKSEHIYQSLIRKGGRFSGINEEFLTEYENFIRDDAQEILISEIDEHIKKLKIVAGH